MVWLLVFAVGLVASISVGILSARDASRARSIEGMIALEHLLTACIGAAAAFLVLLVVGGLLFLAGLL